MLLFTVPYFQLVQTFFPLFSCKVQEPHLGDVVERFYWPYGRSYSLTLFLAWGSSSLTFPALQWMAATLFLCLPSHRSRSSQNGCMSARLGGWWSTKGNTATRLLNLDSSYLRSQHLLAKNIKNLGCFRFMQKKVLM